MQGDFEKQVQQKMEPLLLVPSEPVWQKVELAIRKEKNKRRFLFFLLFALIVGAGGLWYLSETNRIATHVFSSVISKNNSPTTLLNTKKKNPLSPILIVNTPASSLERGSGKLIVAPVANLHKIIHSQGTTKQHETKEYPIQSGNTRHEQIQVPAMQQRSLPVENKILANPIILDKHQDSIITKNNIDSVITTPEKQSISQPVENKVKLLAGKKVAYHKWQRLLYLQAGAASYVQRNSLNNLTYASPVTGNYSGGISNFSNAPTAAAGFSWGIGTSMSKDLSKRIQFSVALQFHYYTTHTRVGKDTVMVFNNQQSFRVYRNSIERDYVNKISVAEIPVSIGYKLFRQTPLIWSAGLVYGRLLHSNALTFSPVSNLYSVDKSNNRKDYFQAESSLQYAFGAKEQFIIGPVFRYSLNKLQLKGYYSSSHLSFVGMETGIKF